MIRQPTLLLIQCIFLNELILSSSSHGLSDFKLSLAAKSISHGIDLAPRNLKDSRHEVATLIFPSLKQSSTFKCSYPLNGWYIKTYQLITMEKCKVVEQRTA